MSKFNLPNDPIIIIGMGTSGTRLMVRVLENCGIFMGGIHIQNEYAESDFFYQGVNQFTDSFRYHIPLKKDWQKLVDAQYSNVNKFCLKQLPKLYYEAGYIRGKWGFKDPRNTFTARIFIRIFPKARLLHVIRDCYDVAESKVKENWGNLPPNRDFEYWTKVWSQVVEVARNYQDIIEDRYYEIRYEDVCKHDKQAIGVFAQLTGCSLQDVKKVIKNIARKNRIGKFPKSSLPPIPRDVEKLRKDLGYPYEPK